jgi:hypothetical protein
LDLSAEENEWFISKASDFEREICANGSVPPELAAVIWLRELALRRCIWCWYAKRPESMGMWNSYGSYGIAIVSSVDRVRVAFGLPKDALSSVGKVTYLPSEIRPQTIDPQIDLLWRDRPYYFKQEAYEYEHEIRFVVACDPKTTGWKGGIIRHVNPEQLIEEVLISPHIYEEEANAIRYLVGQACSHLPLGKIKVSSLLKKRDRISEKSVWEDFPDREESERLLEITDSIIGGHPIL